MGLTHLRLRLVSYKNDIDKQCASDQGLHCLF